MGKIHKVGIIGCGDFLRLECNNINNSKNICVKSIFDTDNMRAEKYAKILGGNVVNTDDYIFDDSEIDIVCIFVPPWARRNLVIKAAKFKKHILTTKPLGLNIIDCLAMVKKVVGEKVKCGVIYGRTGNALIETYKEIFNSGEIGKLSLYKQDWIHHYPVWNKWATDSKKNGGPFMDAMIHNLNVARYLMGTKAISCTYFSDNHSHNLECNDTEFMKLDFEGNAAAYLFITWAADLAVYSKKENKREHIDMSYMITDKGWYLSKNTEKNKMMIVASKEGKIKKWEVKKLQNNFYDKFVKCIEKNTSLPSDIIDISEAYEDIKILKDAEKKQGQKISVRE